MGILRNVWKSLLGDAGVPPRDVVMGPACTALGDAWGALSTILPLSAVFVFPGSPLGAYGDQGLARGVGYSTDRSGRYWPCEYSVFCALCWPFLKLQLGSSSVWGEAEEQDGSGRREVRAHRAGDANKESLSLGNVQVLKADT